MTAAATCPGCRKRRPLRFGLYVCDFCGTKGHPDEKVWDMEPELDIRVRRILFRNNVSTLRDLNKLPLLKLRELRGIGHKARRRIRDVLIRHGLRGTP